MDQESGSRTSSPRPPRRGSRAGLDGEPPSARRHWMPSSRFLLPSRLQVALYCARARLSPHPASVSAGSPLALPALPPPHPSIAPLLCPGPLYHACPGSREQAGSPASRIVSDGKLKARAKPVGNAPHGECPPNALPALSAPVWVPCLPLLVNVCAHARQVLRGVGIELPRCCLGPHGQLQRPRPTWACPQDLWRCLHRVRHRAGHHPAPPLLLVPP